MLLVFRALGEFGSSHSSSVSLFVNVQQLVRINGFSELGLFTDCSLLLFSAGYLPICYVSGD